ncbi:hypothetical protein GIB67_026624 [Kingdonia uniflora]|uniref:Uncharacterized protein n=1 Tax=Kingdonia uniflora TaxID=39325 RepID=A0A7J7NI27_9MAGN|nr:hypothetical protein GIB67_026624 [Kingdonia uniflora]
MWRDTGAPSDSFYEVRSDCTDVPKTRFKIKVMQEGDAETVTTAPIVPRFEGMETQEKEHKDALERAVTLNIPHSEAFGVEKSGVMTLFKEVNKGSSNVGVVVVPVRLISLSEFRNSQFVLNKLIQAKKRKEALSPNGSLFNWDDGIGLAAVKFAKAFDLKVTVISTSPSNEKEAIDYLGADSFIVSRDQAQIKEVDNPGHVNYPLSKLLNVLIDTVVAEFNLELLVTVCPPNSSAITNGIFMQFWFNWRNNNAMGAWKLIKGTRLEFKSLNAVG